MADFGRVLMLFGAILFAVGLVLSVGSRIGLGRLPGDLSFERDGFAVHIPLATSLLLSVILTVILNLWRR
ncbi:MAG: hypothetical protein KatS3mg008_1392 [Acidimicrobiales bacterium]|nr:MAG: hypothetical protein KatS3mg008_1392 [Acidimicrobiales bacterium]